MFGVIVDIKVRYDKVSSAELNNDPNREDMDIASSSRKSCYEKVRVYALG